AWERPATAPGGQTEAGRGPARGGARPRRREDGARRGRNRRMAAPGRGAGRTEQGRGGTGVDAIVVENIVKRFGSVEALRGVSFRVRRGEIFGLLGPNGAGKTTLIRTLLGLLRPAEGRVRIFDMDLERHPEAVHRFVGWVPQERAMDPFLTGRENLLFVAGLHHIPAREARDRVDGLLELVELAGAADRITRGYSGGMRRRLQLAMGLVHRPKVLLLDEPSLGLDEADALCDRVAIIEQGEIRGLDTPDALKQRYGGPPLLVLEWGEPGAHGRRQLIDSLKALPGVREVAERAGGVWVRGDDVVAVTRAVLAECERWGVTPARLSVRQPTLDDVFLAMTGASLKEST